MFSLKSPIGSNYRVVPDDLMNTKRTLNQLGYYDIPPHRGIDDWTDDAMFDGIKQFQKDNDLKVDGFMRPGGETEQSMNDQLSAEKSADGSPPKPTEPGRSDPSGKSGGWPMGKPGPSKSTGMLQVQLESLKRRLENTKTDWERNAIQLQIDRIQALLNQKSE